MTDQAIIAVSQEMGLHEIGLDLLVAGCTDGLFEFGIAITVTGVANKGGTIRLELVRSQRVSEHIMRGIDL